MKFNSQAARFMPSYASKTKDTITLNHCPQTIHHTFILGGDEVGEMTFIFKQHSEGQRWKVGSERQCVHSTVLQGRSSEGDFTSTASPPWKEPPPLHRWGQPHFHFQQFCIQLIHIQQSGPAHVDGLTPAQINHWKGARNGYTSHVFVPQADKLPRSRPSGHVDGHPCNHKNITTRTECRLCARPRPECCRKFPKNSSFLLLFPFSYSFLHLPCLRWFF